MITITKRSNKTRAIERPPYTISPASAAVFVEMARVAVKSAPRRNSRQPQNGARHAPTGYNPPAARTTSPAQAARPTNGAQPPSQGAPVQRSSQASGLTAQNTQRQPAVTPPSALQTATRRVPGRDALFRPGSFTAPPVRPSENVPQNGAQKYPPSNGSAHPPEKPVTPAPAATEPHTPPQADMPRTETGQEQMTRQELDHQTKPASQQIPLPEKPAPTQAQPPVRRATARARLERLLQAHPDLPEQTVVLGSCDDGLPVLLDLHDPAPGAVLVMGDERKAQLEMLRAAVTSLVTRNSPRNVQFLALSCEPQDWTAWVAEQGFQRYCAAIENAEDSSVRDWVMRLADWTEQRRLSGQSVPTILVVMDTLSFLPRLEYDIRLNFEWMAKEGPQAMIWPFAAVSTELAKALSGRRLLRAFQTRILGYASTPADYTQLVNLDEKTAAALDRPGQFIAQAGESWLKFHLPE